jgi:hypothetical protein
MLICIIYFLNYNVNLIVFLFSIIILFERLVYRLRNPMHHPFQTYMSLYM